MSFYQEPDHKFFDLAGSYTRGGKEMREAYIRPCLEEEGNYIPDRSEGEGFVICGLDGSPLFPIATRKGSGRKSSKAVFVSPGPNQVLVVQCESRNSRKKGWIGRFRVWRMNALRHVASAIDEREGYSISVEAKRREDIFLALGKKGYNVRLIQRNWHNESAPDLLMMDRAKVGTCQLLPVFGGQLIQWGHIEVGKSPFSREGNALRARQINTAEVVWQNKGIGTWGEDLNIVDAARAAAKLAMAANNGEPLYYMLRPS